MPSKVVATSPSTGAPTAVLLPGVGYTIQAPLLYWCGQLLAERGWNVQGVEWTVDAEAAANPTPFVEAAVVEAFSAAPPSSERLIVAKSFGSFALPWAHRERVPGIWLTPVLTSEIVRTALSDASLSNLAIGGDADEMWLPADVAGTRSRLVTVPGADHSLTTTGGWRESMEVHARVFKTISRHLDDLVL